jgi:1-acyl-sn-glycerol-3-phosphate acyltransferase
MNRLKYLVSLFVKLILKIYLLRVFKVKYIFGDINIKKGDPYFLVGNHVLLLDAFFSNFAIKGYAVPVVNSFVYTNKLQKIVITKLGDSIVKRKGQSDIQTIKEIKKYIKNSRPVAIYPEGNASYYGDTIESIYSTAKLIKFHKIDVLCVKTKGGYFAKPRWRDKRIKRARIELETFQLFNSIELKEMSDEDIYKKMIDSYYQNDYEWNKKEQIQYLGKNRLDGSHRVIYGCPNCNSINKIESYGDNIRCTNCDTIGRINNFGYIENTKFDNFVEWGNYQERILKDNIDLELNFEIELFKYDLFKFKRYSLGKARLKYINGQFLVKSGKISKEFYINRIIGEVYSEAQDFSFDYNDETFMFRSEHPKLLLDITKFYKEE